MKIDTLIFDMDGVITTEEKYWACARMTLWEVVTDTLGIQDVFGDAANNAEIREAVIPDDLIYALKNRAVNSNWDIAYVAVSVYLAGVPGATVLSARDPDELLEAVRDTLDGPADWPQALSDFLSTTHGAKGHALVQEAGNRLQRSLGLSDGDLLRVDGPFWWFVHDCFQRFYHGEGMEALGAPPLVDGTAIPAEKIEATLRKLTERGFILGSATGRPRDELNDALDELGLLSYFDSTRLSTFDIVRQSEKKLNVQGLSKPHPFSLLRAVYPRADLEILMDEEFQKVRRNNIVVIGDSTSDVMMARAGGCRVVGVLTGVRGEDARQEKRRLLEHAGVEAILDDVTELPDWLEGQED